MLSSGPAARRARDAGRRAAGRLRTPLVLASHTPGLALTYLGDRPRLPARVRELLVALGPAYAKLGQVVSTRVDALPPAWTAELALLRDRLPAEPPEVVAGVLRRAFPQGLDAVLCDLSAQPVAAGTVAQVHRALLPTGEPVAVKVLRPDVRRALEDEFAVLLGLTRAAQLVSRWARVLDLVGLVTELRDLLLSQTDLSHEARNYRRFARAYADDATVRIPRVHMELCSGEVLVTEFVDEIGPYDTDRVALEPADLAKRVDDLVDRMVFLTGLCHADLHPGNFFWTADGRIVLVDLGLVHQLSLDERRHLLTFYSAVLDGFDEFAAGYVLRHLTRVAGAADEDAQPPPGAYADLGRVVRRHWLDSAGQPAFSRMFVDLLGVLGRHGLELRHHYSRLFLTLATVEGYEYSLDPHFDTFENGRRKRVEQADHVGIPPAADALVVQDFATYSTAMFGDGRGPREAWAARDRFVLDALGVEPGTSLVDVGCGRGQLLAAARDRGARTLGITVSRAERDVCAARGLDVVLSSWQAADRHLPQDRQVFDAMAAIEMDAYLGTLHENRAGLVELRLRRFFDWARDHLGPGGRLFVQTLSVEESLLHDAARAAEYRRLTEALPWIGFSTLPQMIRCSDPSFSVVRVLDHSSDLLPTFEFWRDNVNAQLPAIRELVRDEVLVSVRRQLDALIGMAETGQLSLYRLLFRARDDSPRRSPADHP